MDKSRRRRPNKYSSCCGLELVIIISTLLWSIIALPPTPCLKYHFQVCLTLPKSHFARVAHSTLGYRYVLLVTCQADGCFTYEPAVLKEILKGRCLLPEIEQEYQLCRSFWTDAQENWRDTAWHQRIKKHFRRALIESSTPITQVICMGLGSFARHFAFRAHGGDFRDCGDLTYHQLCVLEFLLDLLARHQKTFDAGKVYFQDPSFLDVDEEFLRSKGFSIMRVPQAENMMTSSTFLYAPILPSNLLFDAFTVDYPAVYVGDLRERELEEE